MGGSMELQSSSYLDPSAGRPEFQIRMKRGGTHSYQVIGMKNGFLLLNLGYANSHRNYDGTMGNIGGLLGGQVGRMLGDALESAAESAIAEADDDFSSYSDRDLVQMAKEYKGTLMAPYDDIISVVAEPPKLWDTMTRGGAVIALLHVREKKLKKMTWEIRDQRSLETACSFLPAKLGDRVKVNL